MRRMYFFGYPEIEEGSNVMIVDVAEEQRLGPTMKFKVEKRAVDVKDYFLSKPLMEKIKAGKQHVHLGTFLQEDYLGEKELGEHDELLLKRLKRWVWSVSLCTESYTEQISAMFPEQEAP